jgi:GAF domain-containing protein
MSDNRSFDDILDPADAPADEGRSGHVMDPAEALAELARIDLRTDDLSAVLQRVADLAQKSLPGADAVSVSLIGAKSGVTPAYTAQLALDADESQYEEGGPCVDAAEGGAPVRMDDIDSEERWPTYVPRARAAGVGSSLSVPLPVQEAVTGALNIYSRTPHSFDDGTVDLANAFAGYAAVAIANSQLYETTAALARQMQQAMESRAIIEQAKGLIMGQRRCSADEAFQLLVSASSRSNRKLRDVAADLIASTQGR